MKLTGNVHQPVLMTKLDSEGQWSKVKVTAGHRGCEGNASTLGRQSPSSSSFLKFFCVNFLLALRAVDYWLAVST